MTVSSAIPPIVYGDATILDTKTPLSFLCYWVIPFTLLGLAALASRLLPERMTPGDDVVRKTTFVAFAEAEIDQLIYLATEHANREVGAGKEAYDIRIGSKGIPLSGDDTRESWPATYKVRDRQALVRSMSDCGVVLVHGTNHSAACWDSVLAHLVAPAIAVDLPGRGSRPATIENVTLDDCVQVVIDSADQAGFERCVLVGHSLGAMTVTETAWRHPERVAALIYVGGAVPAPGRAAPLPSTAPRCPLGP